MADVKATKLGAGVFSKQHAELPHLLSHGLSKEIADVRSDVAAVEAPQEAMTVEEWSTAPAVGATLVLTHAPMLRTGATTAAPVLFEMMDGALISPPTGTLALTGGRWVYTPAAAPNATHKYAIWFEYDATKIGDAGGPVIGGAPYVNNNTGP